MPGPRTDHIRVLHIKFRSTQEARLLDVLDDKDEVEECLIDSYNYSRKLKEKLGGGAGG